MTISPGKILCRKREAKSSVTIKDTKIVEFEVCYKTRINLLVFSDSDSGKKQSPWFFYCFFVPFLVLSALPASWVLHPCVTLSVTTTSLEKPVSPWMRFICQCRSTASSLGRREEVSPQVPSLLHIHRTALMFILLIRIETRTQTFAVKRLDISSSFFFLIILRKL